MELGETWSEFRKNHPKGNKEKIMSPNKIIFKRLKFLLGFFASRIFMQVYPETTKGTKNVTSLVK